jgi:hypothetical protein
LNMVSRLDIPRRYAVYRITSIPFVSNRLIWIADE